MRKLDCGTEEASDTGVSQFVFPFFPQIDEVGLDDMGFPDINKVTSRRHAGFRIGTGADIAATDKLRLQVFSIYTHAHPFKGLCERGDVIGSGNCIRVIGFIGHPLVAATHAFNRSDSFLNEHVDNRGAVLK